MRSQSQSEDDEGQSSSGSNDALLGYELICLKFRKAVIAVIAANRLMKGIRKPKEASNQTSEAMSQLNQAEINKCVQLFKYKPDVAVTENIVKSLQGPP